MSRAEFEEAVGDALDTLPPDIADRMDNVVILVEDEHPTEDILGLCTWALDLVDVPWRRSGRWCVSVSRRAGVARLDELVGPKR